MPQLWGAEELLVTKIELGNQSEISLRLKAPPKTEGLYHEQKTY